MKLPYSTALRAGALLVLVGMSSALGQVYPSKPIRFVVPHEAGGANDIVARAVAQKLSENVRQQVIVDNRGGASARIGTALVAKAEADGYTILLANVPHGANPALQSNLPYDTLKDFASITLMTQMPSVLIVHPSLPAKSVKDLVALARAKPGHINYASAGVGSSIHLTMALFIHRTGIELFHVPYKSGAPALRDLMAGQVSTQFVTVAPVLSHVKAGKVIPLGVTSAQRVALLPDVPTIIESGYPGFEDYFWQGVVAPAGTPPQVLARLHAEFKRALDDSTLRERLNGLGATVVASSPEQLTDFIKAQLERWRQVFKSAKRTE